MRTQRLEDEAGRRKGFQVESIQNNRIQFTTHTTLQGVSPHQVYNYLVSMDDEGYRLFHPSDHREYRVLHRPRSGLIGTVVYMKEQYANGYVSSAKAKFADLVPDRKIVLKSVSPWWQPCTLVFAFEASDSGTVVTHHMQIGSALPVIGRVYNRMVELFFLSEENTAAIYTHVKEEYSNLERILQNRA